MRRSIITNEWTDAVVSRPIVDRPVLVRCTNSNMYVARWNGFYWVNNNSGLRSEPGGLSKTQQVQWFYMFEKFSENNVDWNDADLNKPVVNVPVVVRCSQGNMYVARWNGYYWINHNSGLRTEPGGLGKTHHVKWFYTFEKFDENNIL